MEVKIFYYKTLSTEILMRLTSDKSRSLKWHKLQGNYMLVDAFSLNDEHGDNGQILHNIFEKYNDDDANPLSNKQEFIKEHNLHTSMSVTDVIHLDNDYYMVSGSGFEKMK